MSTEALSVVCLVVLAGVAFPLLRPSVRVLRFLSPTVATSRELPGQVRRLRVAVALLTTVTWLSVLLGLLMSHAGPEDLGGAPTGMRRVLSQCGDALGWLALILCTSTGYVVVVYGAALAFESRLRKALIRFMLLAAVAVASSAMMRAVLGLHGG